MTTSTNFSFQFGQDIENFPPEIIFDPEDVAQCSPVAYFPTLIVADDQELLPNQIKAAWQVSKYKYKDEEAEDKLDTREEVIDSNSKVIYVSVKDDDGQETICKTKELKLARFGREIVRVFGPLKIKSWEAFGTGGSVVYTDMIKKRDVDLSATERLIPFPGLNQSANTIADKYEVKIKDAATFDDRGGNFDAEYERENKQGLSTTF